MLSVIVLSFVVVGFNNLRLRTSAVATSPAARDATPRASRATSYTTSWGTTQRHGKIIVTGSERPPTAHDRVDIIANWLIGHRRGCAARDLIGLGRPVTGNIAICSLLRQIDQIAWGGIHQIGKSGSDDCIIPLGRQRRCRSAAGKSFGDGIRSHIGRRTGGILGWLLRLFGIVGHGAARYMEWGQSSPLRSLGRCGGGTEWKEEGRSRC
jgi:hypothetical protein